MATPDPLSAVSPDVAARTKAILEAVATGGSAGLKAYEQSQGAMTQAKTDAVTRAQQRANLIGGPEAQGFEAAAAGQYDRGISNLGTARTGFEGHMASLGSAHKNYLDQVNAAVPLVRADTQRQLAFKQQALNDALDKEMAKLEKAAEPKFEDLMGEAQWKTDSPDWTAAERAAGAGPQDESSSASGRTTGDIARSLATDVYGMTPAETNAVLTPSKLASYAKATAPAQDSTVKALATKYDTKGVTYDLAKSVVNNEDYKADVAWIQAGADGKSRDEVEKMMREWYLIDRNWPSEYEILMGEYVNKLPKK